MIELRRALFWANWEDRRSADSMMATIEGFTIFFLAFSFSFSSW